MTDRQFYAKEWLNRMYHVVNKIESLERKRDNVVSSMSGIGKYDAEHIPAQTGENASESKNIAYSILSAEIEKEYARLLKEDSRTLEVINTLGNTPEAEIMKAILIDRYLNRLSWEAIAKHQSYGPSRTYELHSIALDKIYPNIPREIISE